LLSYGIPAIEQRLEISYRQSWLVYIIAFESTQMISSYFTPQYPLQHQKSSQIKEENYTYTHNLFNIHIHNPSQLHSGASLRFWLSRKS